MREPPKLKITRQEMALPVKENWPVSLNLKKGQTVHITASGTWQAFPRGKWHDPNDSAYYLQGRFGAGLPFRVGADYTLSVEEDTVLHLEMREEADRTNNSGSIVVVVEVTDRTVIP